MTAYLSGLASGSGLYAIAYTAALAGGVQPASSRGPSNGYPASEPSRITALPLSPGVLVLADRLGPYDRSGSQAGLTDRAPELLGGLLDRLLAAHGFHHQLRAVP